MKKRGVKGSLDGRKKRGARETGNSHCSSHTLTANYPGIVRGAGAI